MKIQSQNICSSVSDPKRLWSDPDPTFLLIPDPDPGPDPCQNKIFERTQNKLLFTNHSELYRVGLLYCLHNILM